MSTYDSGKSKKCICRQNKGCVLCLNQAMDHIGRASSLWWHVLGIGDENVIKKILDFIVESQKKQLEA